MFVKFNLGLKLLNSKFHFSDLVRRDRVTGLFISKKQRKPDRFNLNKIHDNQKLFDIAQNPLLTLTLNEYISILHRIVQINENIDKKTLFASQEILQNINARLRDTQDENPFIAFSLKHLNKYNDLNLWVQKMDYIVASVYDDEYDEILNIVQGFDNIQSHLKEAWQVELYQKSYQCLKPPLYLSIQQNKFNIKQIKEILSHLIRNQIQIEEEIIQETEFQTMKQIYKEEQDDFILQDLVWIGFYFYKAGYRGENLMSYVQEQFDNILNQQDMPKLLINEDLINYIEWHNYYFENSISNVKQIQKEYILYCVLKQNFCQKLNNVLAFHTFLKNFDIENIDQYFARLKEQFLKIPTSQPCQLIEIQDYIQIRQQITDFINEDKDVIEHLDQVMVAQMINFNPAQIFFFLNFLEEEEQLQMFPNFFHKLPSLIHDQYINEIDFDDLCYFYVVFVLNSHIINLSQLDIDFHGNVNNIKSHIKFVTQRRGFKIDLDSHFHRLLNVVDLAEFFDGGEY